MDKTWPTYVGDVYLEFSEDGDVNPRLVVDDDGEPIQVGWNELIVYLEADEVPPKRLMFDPRVIHRGSDVEVCYWAGQYWRREDNLSSWVACSLMEYATIRSENEQVEE
jgi:hypothetical protein